MLYLNVEGYDPTANLALEEYMLTRFPTEEEIFLLWQNDSTVVVGVHQNVTEEVDTVYAAEDGITIVRRPTGGGAVFHDLGNVNYSFIAPCSDEAKIDFAAFSRPMVNTLRRMGVNAEMTGRNDLTVDGKKFSGGAQTVRSGRILHHGCILFHTDFERMQRVLTVRGEKVTSKGAQSVRNRVTNLSEHLPVGMTVEEFKRRLIEDFIGGDDAQKLMLPEGASKEIVRLRDERYRNPEWTYGRSPGYRYRKEKRFPAGKVTVSLEVGRGERINGIAINGDFFGSGDIGALEQALAGLPMKKDTLLAVLEKTGLERYILGVTAGELAELILS